MFYLNGTDVRSDLMIGESEQRGGITFPLTQAREGYYTCGNGNMQSQNELYLVGEYIVWCIEVCSKILHIMTSLKKSKGSYSVTGNVQ